MELSATLNSSRKTPPTSSNVHRLDGSYLENKPMFTIVSFPVLSMCMYPFLVSLWSFSVSFRSFSVSFRSFSVSFRSFSVSFGPFRCLFGVFPVSFRSFFGVFSVLFRCLFGPFRCLFGPFRYLFGSFSVQKDIAVDMPMSTLVQCSTSYIHWTRVDMPIACQRWGNEVGTTLHQRWNAIMGIGVLKTLVLHAGMPHWYQIGPTPT